MLLFAGLLLLCFTNPVHRGQFLIFQFYIFIALLFSFFAICFIRLTYFAREVCHAGKLIFYRIQWDIIYLTFIIFPTEAPLLICDLPRGPVSTSGVQCPNCGVMILFLEKLECNLIAHTN
jgi:hypothetical protein